MRKIVFLSIVLFVLVAVALAADVDTRNKRAGAIGIHMFPCYALPDGTIDAYDRGQTIGIYPLGAGSTVAIPKQNAVIRLMRFLY